MSYAAAKPQIPTTAALTTVDAAASLDLDAESASVITRNDAWLVSFIDILILLLTLFVLLLTYQQDGRSADPGNRISSDSATEAASPSPRSRMSAELGPRTTHGSGPISRNRRKLTSAVWEG